MKKEFVSFRLDESLYEFTRKYVQSKRTTVIQVPVDLILEFYQKESEYLQSRRHFLASRSLLQIASLRSQLRLTSPCKQFASCSDKHEVNGRFRCS